MQCRYILKQWPHKVIKSKAIIEDKVDEVEIISNVDYMMGGCDGLNATSGADTVHF